MEQRLNKKELVQQQLAQRDAVQARRSSPESIARKNAVMLFPHVRGLGLAMNNPDCSGERILADHILAGNPIPFVGFWGVGEKEAPDALDREYVRRLQEKRELIAGQHIHGAAFTFILADLHGVFNGFLPRDGRSAYLDQVEQLLHEAGFATVRLSELYGEYGLALPSSQDPIDYLSEANQVFGRHKEQYSRSARRHHNGAQEDEQGGYWYVAMRLQERDMLEGAFPDSFLLVNGTKMTASPLMPKSMPVIYLPEGPVWFRGDKNGGLPSEARV